jgi:preprotein translocase subunit SecB
MTHATIATATMTRSCEFAILRNLGRDGGPIKIDPNLCLRGGPAERRVHTEMGTHPVMFECHRLVTVACSMVAPGSPRRERPMSEAGSGINGGNVANGGEAPARVQIIGQYVKDLSFENPGAPMTLTVRPQIDLGVDLQARRLDPERYEIELKLRVSAKSDEKAVFLLELVYGGLFLIQSAPEELLQPLLLIEGPHLLFPFARRIVADIIRDGGMPPLMIEPIDFQALYRAKMAQAQPAATQPV